MTKALIEPPPDGWMTLTLGELCARGRGDVQTGPFGSQLHASDYVPVGIPSIMPVNIGDNRVVAEGIARITEADAHRLARYRLQVGDVVYSRRGDVERRALIREREVGWLCGTGCLRIRPGSEASGEWLSYYLGHPEVRAWIVRHAIGATMPNLNTSILSALPVTLPPLRLQLAIAEVLSALDDKIENSHQVASRCQQLALALFDSALSFNEQVVKVDDVAEFHNRRRIPLSGRERAKRQGQYPYYGAVGILDHVDDFLFDGTYVLVGEDGTVTIDDVHPMVQYVWGRFWVNNHAHVLSGKGISQELLRIALLRLDVTSALTGAVQPKLNMGNLKAMKLRLPGRRRELEEVLAELATVERLAAETVVSAAALRDTLLPPLLSGELRVRDGEELVGEAV